MDAGTTNGVDLGELALAVTKLQVRVEGSINALLCLPNTAQLINTRYVDNDLTSIAFLDTLFSDLKVLALWCQSTQLDTPCPPRRQSGTDKARAKPF
jgi:hypothetical protein